MTTQPPNPETVEAARKWVAETPWKLPWQTCIRSFTQVGYWALPEEKLEAAARILAAEVERLRAKEEEVCEWSIIESGENAGLVDTQCGWRCEQTADYCPGCGRKVKIQPQTNEQ